MRKLVLALCVAVAGVAQAQMPNFNPPKEVDDLKWMVGEFTGTVKWTMEGMNMDVPLTMKNDLDGQFFRSVSTMDMGGMKITETMYIGWDAAKKEYVSYTFTNMSPAARIEHGKLNGSAFVFVSEPWEAAPGMKHVSRATMTKKSNDEVHFLLEFKMGETWTKVGEGTFKRTK